jgi:hypothetical protein
MRNLVNFIGKKMSYQRPPAAVGRWSQWARSMSGRHRQVVSKHRFVVMTLLRRTVPLYLSSHRWELKAWSIFPRINLAIDVRPQAFVFKTSPLSKAAQAQRVLQINNDRFEVKRLVEKSLELQQARHIRQERSDDGTAIGRTERETIVVTPLDRVFRRLAIRESETHMKAIVRTEALNIVRRITDERRRVEERTQTATVLRQQQAVSLSQEQMNELTGRSTNGASALDRFGNNVRNAGAMPAPFMTPNLNLQQLTDHVIRQIDDRIIAHKERMGKLF